jgi:hypothetical protein
MTYGWMLGDHVAGNLFPIFESFVALTAHRRGEVARLGGFRVLYVVFQLSFLFPRLIV